MTIQRCFRQLQPPAQTAAGSFHAAVIPPYENFRVGVDHLGRPAVLISEMPGFSLGNFRLKYLEISIRHSCQVVSDGRVQIEDLVLIHFRTTDEALSDYFFSMMETFLLSLSRAADITARQLAYTALLEIFRSLNDDPLSTAQGLWSELFLISQGKNVAMLMEAWHHLPSDRFDFVSDSTRLEVKSSKNLMRVHTFAAFQLIPDAGTTIYIASLFAIESASGISLQAIIAGIKQQLDDFGLQLKLERIVARTLGRGIAGSLKMKFDVEVANRSLCFYNAADVPKIEQLCIPNRVSDVHFKADLSNLIPLRDQQYFFARRV